MKQNQTIVIIALVVVAAIAAYFMMKGSPAVVPTGPQTSTVDIKDLAFSPDTLTISVGDTVTWTNSDSVKHLVASSGIGGIASSTLNPGASYSKTFTKAGTYAYHCEIHPSMKGTIIVQ